MANKTLGLACSVGRGGSELLAVPGVPVYTEAKASVLPRAQPGHRTQLMLEEKLMVLARPFLKDPLAVQAKLCRRMERFIKDLVCYELESPAVIETDAFKNRQPTERSLRAGPRGVGTNLISNVMK